MNLKIPKERPHGGDLPAKKSRLKSVLLTLSMAFLVLGVVSFLGIYWLKGDLDQRRQFDEHIFQIKKGDTLNSFAQSLRARGVIDNTYSLNLFARYTGRAGKLHTGHYQFKDGLNLREVLDAITSGEYRLRYYFTFVQGSTFKQLRQSLESAEALNQTLRGKSDAQVLAQFDSGHQYTRPEGLFFPDTYAYHPGESDLDILTRAYAAMQLNLDELWADRAENLAFDSPYEALILASIIEKETGLGTERPLISGVFANRLKIGMRLQTDPTVIYGMGDEYDGNITRSDLKTDTEYNTYTRYGLPPTPISMPGRAAIAAALNPVETDALYFVAKGDGSRGHTFSRTLAEHNRAVKRYLKALRKSG